MCTKKHSRSLEVYWSTGSYAVPAVHECNVHADSPSRGTVGVRRNTSGYVLPQNELARFLTIGPTLVHAYFSITFSIQYPERGTREGTRGKESGSGTKGEAKEIERDIRTELPRSPSPCLSSSSSYLSLTPSHCPRESICYCFCVCGRRGERSERDVYRWVASPATNAKWVGREGGGRVGVGASRALAASKRCFSARQRGDQEGRNVRAGVAATSLDSGEREGRGKRALSKLERDGRIDTRS